MAKDDATSSGALSDPSQWVDAHGDALYRYALPRVRDAATADDLVQETFLAALSARGTFAGRASDRTWFVAILRRKIVDHLRAVDRRGARETSGGEAEEMFDKAGRWSAMPRGWPKDPKAVLLDREFWDVFQECVSQMPAALAQTFVLREVNRASSDDLCKILSISPSNLWTRLHRARLLLRRCLESHWFSAS